MHSLNFSEIKSLRGYSVEWDSKDKLILAKGNVLYETKKNNLKVKTKIGQYPLPIWKKILIRSRILQRLLRCFFYNVIVIKINFIPSS